MFIDQTTIKVRSGKGGDGMVHFRREKFVPRGGPDGGDGGKGGDVIIEAATAQSSLNAYHRKKHHVAEDGKNGGPSQRSGRSAENLILPVPLGTIVYDAASGDVLADLVEPGQRLVAVKGGRGGRGNQHYATARNQVPRIAEKGEPNQERELRLELKLIADVGIIGVPNAGKSTLLAAISNANPKIADYPFTTLSPNLGVAVLDDYASLVLADIPGLIEGAHLGIGLGHDFLRHVQRTRVLIHVLDGLAEDPLADYDQINSELSLFDETLSEKPQLVVVNKADLPDVKDRWPEWKAALEARGLAPALISAASGEGVRALLYQAHTLLEETPMPDTPAALPVYRPQEDPRIFEIKRLSGEEWQVVGAAIERAASMTYWQHDQSARRFQRLLETLGIDEALRTAGVKNGHTVHIGDYELEWED
ncbi:MAG: GTPase ObgE [Anaerolineae bacterium]|nr:MAG: GTPase ObgE [Anaerolineae bacterium]